jgi:hypothetical protein
VLAGRLREQAGWCRRLGSPLYAHLLSEVAADVEAGGPAWAVLAGHEGDSRRSALPLRFMGGIHRLVLEGRAPALARHYPSAGGRPDPARAWPPLRDVLEQQGAVLRTLLTRPVQTNEVGRSAALMGGFLLVGRDTSLPLRLLEIGASAGLNLRWDHYRYEAPDCAWGDPASPVRFAAAFVEGRPPLAVPATVTERRGCDRAPVDPCSADGQLTLRSYIWPDQDDRLALLAGALEVARRVPAMVDTADAPDWLAAQLAQLRPGVATVVFQSIVVQYLTAEGRERIQSLIEEAGQRATASAPVAWLRMEPNRGDPGEATDVRLTLWPGGAEQLLARASPHGTPVRWLVS